MRIFSYEAAVAADEEKLDELVANGVDFDEPHWVHHNRAVLHVLAEEGNEKAVELLVRKGANIEVQDGDGCTPLHVAAWEGHANVVHKLIELGANVHALAAGGETPLHYVAEFGKAAAPSSTAAILRALLDQGGASNLLVRGSDGDTPLHLAAFNGNATILQELLTAFCNISSAGPPATASSNIDELLRNHEGRTPLHYAAGKGNAQAVRPLLHAGASQHARDAHGATPFHFAARCGDTLVLDALQVENVDDPSSSTQMTALHYAAWNGRNEAIQWLLARGASVDVIDAIEGDTPLHWASRKGSSSVVKSLIEAGSANAQLMNKKGELPLGLADEAKHHDAAKALVRGIRMSGQDRIQDSLWTKHSTNGATLLHYFAAYGTTEDLKWIVGLIQSKTASNVVNDVNTRDKSGRNAVHWAAMMGNKDVVKVLAENRVDLNADSEPCLYKTPLSLAVINGEIEFAEELLKLKPRALNGDDWLHGLGSWMNDYYLYNQDGNLDKKLGSLTDGFELHTKPSIYPPDVFSNMFFEIPPIYLALHAEREDIAHFIQRHSRGVEDAVNERGKRTGRTALHWATLLRQRKIVAQLCRTEVFARELTANVEDALGKTALQYAKEMGFDDIEKELLQRSDVIAYVDGMYRDRQLYVDAANAILVGAALIAGVTFAGWLQPPLNYADYYNLPELAPPSPSGVFPQYAAVKQHVGVRAFWVFNSLSFSFAIATVLAGLVAVVPIPGVYIVASVAHLRRCLLMAAALLGLSIVFVLGAFAAAGFTVLPPLFEYQANMMATMIVGGIPCLLLLAWFASRLWPLRPDWSKSFQTKVFSMLGAGHIMHRQTQNQKGKTTITRSTSMLDLRMQHDQQQQQQQESKHSVGKRYHYIPWDDGLDILLQKGDS